MHVAAFPRMALRVCSHAAWPPVRQRDHWPRPHKSLIAVAAVTMLCAMASAGGRGTAGSASVLAAARVDRTDAAGITWLCRPGLPDDPCAANSAATAIQADGARTLVPAAPAATPAVDCFYVYPTASTEHTLNADLTVQPAEVAAAVAQASRFSQVCEVWAPMYRQHTLYALATGKLTAAVLATAYQSLLKGWKDYLTHYNHGRPLVLIGHSQGDLMLIALLEQEFDRNSALRRRLVSAIVPGGNVTVPTTAGATGSFQHIPACRSAGQVGCVIAYSTYPTQPPPDSLFGRPGQGAVLPGVQSTVAGLQVLCTNPAALGGGRGALDSFYPTSDLPPRGVQVTTPWVEYPNRYTAQCEHAGGATWLEVTSTHLPGDQRPRLREGRTGLTGPRWGFHIADINLGLGNLIRDVQAEERAYRSTP